MFNFLRSSRSASDRIDEHRADFQNQIECLDGDIAELDNEIASADFEIEETRLQMEAQINDLSDLKYRREMKRLQGQNLRDGLAALLGATD